MTNTSHIRRCIFQLSVLAVDRVNMKGMCLLAVGILFLAAMTPRSLQGQVPQEIITACSVCSPVSVHAADVDGDGDTDILSASVADDKIAWLENDGGAAPSFTGRTITNDAQDANSVYAADVDGDGDTDVLSASQTDDKIAWYENDGSSDPSFTARTITTSANGALDVYAADVDGDGDTDIVSASTSEIAWYENDGASTPSFTDRTITTNVSGGSGVYVADVDGDSDLDVLSASFFDDKIAWYENDGASDPSFTARTITTSADGARSVFATDVDGDSDLDVLSASTSDNNVTWYESDGTQDPSFTARTITTGATNVWGVYATDVDGDGDTDVLSASQADDKIAWYENDGSSTPSFATHTITTSANGARGVFAADVDGDSDPDVLSASFADDKIAWYENDGAEDPSFGAHPLTGPGFADGAWDVYATDVDGDSDADVLSASEGDNKIAWYENDGASDPSFTAQTITTSASGARDVFATDVDGDSDPDVLSASQFDNKIAWYENDGTQDPSFTVRTITVTASRAQSVFATDVDGDGDTDVLSASEADDKIAWYENDGDSDPGFTARTITTSADGAQSVFATDMDGDGDPDVLSASANDDTIAWYENDGAQPPNFTAQTVTTSANGARDVYATDVDGDGDTDVLSASEFDSRITWYENDGAQDPSFTPRTITTNAGRAASVFATDVDGDSDVDVLSASRFDNKIAWYKNDGAQDPSFTAQTITTSAGAAESVFATDVDGDLDTDVLSASPSDDKIAWYKNTDTALPVEIASFEATADGQAVRLAWQTASETRNARFEVERNAGDGTWTRVGTVQGSGTTTEARSYRFTDQDLPYEADRLAYRLRQVDVDGTAQFSKTVTVERRVNEVELLGTYPNPAQGQATVRYALPGPQEVSLRLYDMLGRRVRTVVQGEQSGRQERRVDVSGLSSGVYFLRLTAGEQTRTRRLTIVR